MCLGKDLPSSCKLLNKIIIVPLYVPRNQKIDDALMSCDRDDEMLLQETRIITRSEGYDEE